MISAELCQALDNIASDHEAAGTLCRFLRYAVEARGGYALVEAIEQGKDPRLFSLQGKKATLGITLPSQQLSTLIYVPKPLMEMDETEKAKNEYSGITLFSADQVNAFHDGTEWQAQELVKAVILRDCNGEEIVKALQENWAFRLLAKQYCQEFIMRVRDLVVYESEKLSCTISHPELPVLAFNLATQYAEEMGLSR